MKYEIVIDSGWYNVHVDNNFVDGFMEYDDALSYVTWLKGGTCEPSV
jgi:hypothetical protein